MIHYSVYSTASNCTYWCFCVAFTCWVLKMHSARLKWTSGWIYMD